MFSLFILFFTTYCICFCNLKFLGVNITQRIVSFGTNGEGELGNNIEFYSSIAVGVNHSEALHTSKIIDQCTYGDFTIVLIQKNVTIKNKKTQKNILVSWGNNENGQLGIGEDIGQTNFPTYVNDTAFGKGKVIKVACGEDHSIAITDSGGIFSFGDNSFGQLGFPGISKSFIPVPIPYFKGKHIKEIFTGGHLSFALDTKNVLYCWGKVDSGACGENRIIDKVPHVFNVSFVVKSVHSGAGHSILISDKDEVYSLGENSEGQLGLGDYQPRYKPVRIKSLTGSVQAVCVNENHNSVVIGSNHFIFNWGSNGFGQLGTSDLANRNVPTEPTGSKELDFVQVACGKFHKIYLTSDQKLFGTGLNDLGQLGDNTLNNRMNLKELEYTPIISKDHPFPAKYLEISAGSHHSIMLTEGVPFCNQKKYDDENVCSNWGVCTNEDYCVCNSEDRKGTYCQYWMCFEKWIPCAESWCVCSGKGICKSKDFCDCNHGYSGNQCQFIECFGKKSNDPAVCDHHGVCIAPDYCKCIYPKFGGDDCSQPICYKILANNPGVCSGNGDCVAPNECRCHEFYMNDECNLNSFVLATIIIIAILILALVLFLLCCRKIIERRKFSSIFFFKKDSIKRIFSSNRFRTYSLKLQKTTKDGIISKESENQPLLTKEKGEETYVINDTQESLEQFYNKDEKLIETKVEVYEEEEKGEINIPLEKKIVEEEQLEEKKNENLDEEQVNEIKEEKELEETKEAIE